MSEIGTLSLERLNNGAHFLFISNVLARAEADANVKSKLSAQIVSLKAAMEQEDEDLKISQKSMLTDDIATADAERDGLYSSYKKAVNGFRNLPVENMASQLEATWKKLYPAPTQVKVKPASPTVTPSSRSSRPVTPKPTSTQTKVQSSVQPKPTPAKTVFNIYTGSEVKKLWIPDSVKGIFLNEAQVPEDNDTAIVKNVVHTAMLLFAGYIDAATSMSESCGGGGGSVPESGWGKKDDEDNRLYARRCLQMAHSMCKPKPRQRGYHR